MAAAPGGPLVPDRPIDVFCGTWKRCLSSRVFGTFSLARDSNTVVHVEQVVDGPAAGAGPATYAPPYGSRPAPAVVAAPLALGGAHPYRMRWSFGRSPDAVRAGYTIEPLFEAVGGTASGAPGIGGGPSPSSSPAARVIPLRVSYGGSECLGTYQQELGLLMAHLVGASGTATIIYRVIDEDSECGGAGTRRGGTRRPFSYCTALPDSRHLPCDSPLYAYSCSARRLHHGGARALRQQRPQRERRGRRRWLRHRRRRGPGSARGAYHPVRVRRDIGRVAEGTGG